MLMHDGVSMDNCFHLSNTEFPNWREMYRQSLSMAKVGLQSMIKAIEENEFCYEEWEGGSYGCCVRDLFDVLCGNRTRTSCYCMLQQGKEKDALPLMRKSLHLLLAEMASVEHSGQ
ncbi:hypothetical protein IMZ31_24245 (plasmid) [Pontibacillus sp. ALD_SL1]|uniref:hypothetical protein n=1 Tax=Pontibacillus sp. ALD_SL1 TaxID=2777185 RepID=UPI001A978C21|nr:hypothetical protein [Pontibacillus sp. ALD_SL1]QST02564.1 hypothetical protein IMZ31_24245 [Pontibacillus sp. ALD_SL1]